MTNLADLRVELSVLSEQMKGVRQRLTRVELFVGGAAMGALYVVVKIVLVKAGLPTP